MKKSLIVGFLIICAIILLSAHHYTVSYTTYILTPQYNGNKVYSMWIASKVKIITWSKPDSIDCIKHAKEDVFYKGLSCDSIACNNIEKNW